MKKYFYFLIPSIVITFIIYLFLSCYTPGSSGGEGDDDDDDSSPSVNLDNILGGWIYCDNSFNPSQNIEYGDYAMMHIKTDKTDYGYIVNPDGGDFWTYYEPSQIFIGALMSSDYSGTWRYMYSSAGVNPYTYSVGYDYIRGSDASQPNNYYQLRFNYQNPSTNAIVYYGYSSDGNYIEITSEPYYFKKNDNFINKGNNGTEIR